MRFEVITIFPELFESPLKVSLIGKAIENGLIEVALHNLRRWAPEPHRKVDDTPFGGGPGMVMSPGPVVEAVEAVARPGARVIQLSASGEPLTQRLVEQLAGEVQIVLVCGRYEGMDARIQQVLGSTEVSVGPYVLAGGEAAALVLIEAVGRLVPGVLGNERSLGEESFTWGLLEYPQYTRPAEFRGLNVPEVLLSGHHRKIAEWRRQEAISKTALHRPELLEQDSSRAEHAPGASDII
ncbi:MAG: tRNA (guanosine(37)-N1)-methyltransferase TrmD [Actinomycetota bacterium]